MNNACDACQQAHKKCLFVVQPFQPRVQRSSHPRHPCEDSFVVNDDESIPEWEWTSGPQTGRQEQFRTINPVPSSIDLSTPLLGHHQMVTSLLDRSRVIIGPMKDGDGKRTTKQTKSPVPSLPCEKTLQKPTQGPSVTQWSEDSCRGNKKTIPLLFSTFDSSELTLPPFVEPSQPNEPPIPGLSQPSEPHEDTLTHEPEPEVAPTQSTEEPFDPPIASSPHSHSEAWQVFTDLRPTRATVHKSINQILLENCQLVYMIPFVDAAHQNEMNREFWEELNSLLGQALEAYPKEDITGIVSSFLKK
ncbi:hypothetical protein O181_058312 [Austropuccinia psidii MF-1]|uniref:Uncharacterized protein n=1 Tax=Austropuccinia psidii MF-1 TaxID=1389203 RepID=A0A9Q3EJH9_9BASI|nr:hypothetical protein [Austropuccinia psidii MF-1]